MRTVFWRRLDVPGLERLTLSAGVGWIRAVSTVLCAGEGGFEAAYVLEVTDHWRTRFLQLRVAQDALERTLRVERHGRGWLVDGVIRPDLDGCEELDLSITPFCNTLPIHRLGPSQGDAFTLAIAFVDGVQATVVPSRQRYERLAPRRVRYVDLGLFAGFQAELDVDGDGLVARYGELFERVPAVPG